MLTYWEQHSFCNYDHIVIGAGIVGLSVAVELKEKFPGDSVLVLERGLLPTGASTRNAGFACMGSVTELLDDLQTSSEEEVVHLFARRKKGLELLRERLGDSAIAYAANGSYELINEEELPALDRIAYLNQLLLPVLDAPAFRMANEQIAKAGFSGTFTRAMIENIWEGELNSGKMMRALAQLASTLGVELRTGATTIRYDESAGGATVIARDNYRQEEWHLQCRTLCLCTNAFAEQLLPGSGVTPGRGQVLVTSPVPGLKFKGIYHFDKGYFYFRELDGRVLLGGGRNLDFEGETTTEIALNQKIQEQLDLRLKEIILPGMTYTVEHRWAGIMAFGPTKSPVVKAISPHVFGCYRMGGMGVALGSLAAREVVTLIAGG
jgi:glycine/D-amino acid oxidase-like deaminating enzyme